MRSGLTLRAIPAGLSPRGGGALPRPRASLLRGRDSRAPSAPRKGGANAHRVQREQKPSMHIVPSSKVHVAGRDLVTQTGRTTGDALAARYWN